MFGKHPALLAMANATNRFLQRRCKGCSSLAVALQQMKSNSLCRLAADARHATQGIDHLYQQW